MSDQVWKSDYWEKKFRAQEKQLEAKDAEIADYKELLEAERRVVGKRDAVIERLTISDETHREQRDLWKAAHYKTKADKERLQAALKDGPPTRGAVGTTYIEGWGDVEMEADWCEIDEVMEWWAKVEDALQHKDPVRDASCIDSACEGDSHKPWCDHYGE